MKTLRWISVLMIGVLAGYGIALWQHRPPPPTPAATAQIAAPPAVVPAQRPDDTAIGRAVVYVDMYNAHGTALRRTSGVLTAPGHTLIVPVSDLSRAQSGLLSDTDGRQYALSDVIAVDATDGVAAVATAVPAGPAFQLSGDNDQLYLGREVQALTPEGKISGWVDSAPLERNDGSTYYKLHTRQPLHWRLTALVDPATGLLLGMTVAATEKHDIYEAVDAGVIADMMDNRDAEPRTLAEFSRYYTEQTMAGRLEHLQSLADAGRWEALIQTSDGLLDSHHHRDRDRAHRLLERAYRAAAADALHQGHIQHASDLLDQAARRLGDDPARLQLRAEADRQRGDPVQARRALHAALDMDPSLADVIRPKLKDLVRSAVEDNGQLSTQEKIQLVETESARDPDDAGYHRLLGQLYYRQGNYDAALDQLTQAVTLNNALQSDLAPMMRNARQRMSTPALTNVPLVSAGDNYLVPVRINGDSQVLNFMLDTGASYTAISAAAADLLGIRIPADAPRMTLDTANGVIKAPLITLNSLGVDGAVVKEINVTVLDSVGDYDGLLGGSFLRHFDFDLSQSDQRLVLKRR